MTYKFLDLLHLSERRAADVGVNGRWAEELRMVKGIERLQTHFKHFRFVKVRHFQQRYVPVVLGVSAQGVVVKPLSDTSLCLKTCVIMSSNNDSRLANEFARSFLRRYEPQILSPKQMDLLLSA
jgi:hypothetical protein